MNRFLPLLILALAGCSSTNKLSVAKFDANPRPPTKKVDYFDDENQVRRPFTVIAIVSVPGEGADVQSSTLTQVLSEALDEARKLGGDAVILHRTNAAPGGPAATTLYKVIVFTPVAPGATTR